MKRIISTLLITGLLSMPSVAKDIVTDTPKGQTFPKVIFFDVNETLLNLGNVASSVTQALDGRDDLVPLWFTTMLQYSLVSNATNDYHHFGELGVASLKLVAQKYDIELTEAEAKLAIQTPFRYLQPHQDVIAGLKRFKDSGAMLVTLTNSSDAGIASQLNNAKLTEFFDGSLTVESLKVFKPDLRVYEWALAEMDVKPENAMLIAAHSWDIAGASKAGMQTAFIERDGQYQFELVDKADYSAPDLIKLADQIIPKQSFPDLVKSKRPR